MIKPKVLIIEDEPMLALDIKNSIIQMGFLVTDTVKNHDDALESVQVNEPDFIIVDINVNANFDGIETVLSIQKINNIFIIYLSEFSDEQRFYRSVHTNPLAYLSKPFKKEELKRTLLLGQYKMSYKLNKPIFYNGVDIGWGYFYDFDQSKLFYHTLPIRLSKKENQLLRILIDAKGGMVPFSTIEYTIWPEEPTCESSLRTLIYRLRSKLEYKLIETVPTFGCRLVEDV